MRGIAVLSAILGIVVCLLPANAKSATTTHSLDQIITWEKQQIANQKQIIRDKMVWRVLTKNTAVGVPLAVQQLRAHQVYLRKLQVRLAANLKEQKLNRRDSVSPRLSAWICIHRYEGAWNANTGNGYYGGLQMDLGFQRTYGPELLNTRGTADKWTPKEQIMVADRAYESRGYGPWPNTARYCGLL